MLTRYQRLRYHTFHLLETEENKSKFGRLLDFLLSLLIFANVLVFVLETDAQIGDQYQDIFQRFELFSLLVFIIEYLLRLWSVAEKNTPELSDRDEPEPISFVDGCKLRLQWIFSPLALIDLIVILPSLLQHFFAIDLRVLRMLRMLRILKLTRYSASLRMLLKVLRQESGSLKAMLFILVILIMLSASGIYAVEYKVQPEHFGSIPKAMWWSVVTLTTVGYGDVIPITPIGKVFGACITILGIGIAALPAGILASGFANELKVQRKQKEQQFREAIIHTDGALHRAQKIEKIRKKIGINKGIAAHIVRKMRVESSILGKQILMDVEGADVNSLAVTAQDDAVIKSKVKADGSRESLNSAYSKDHDNNTDKNDTEKNDTGKNDLNRNNVDRNSTGKLLVKCPCCQHTHEVSITLQQ